MAERALLPLDGRSVPDLIAWGERAIEAAPAASRPEAARRGPRRTLEAAGAS